MNTAKLRNNVNFHALLFLNYLSHLTSFHSFTLGNHPRVATSLQETPSIRSSTPLLLRLQLPVRRLPGPTRPTLRVKAIVIAPAVEYLCIDLREFWP